MKPNQLTITQALPLLGVTRLMAYNYLQTGKLPSVKETILGKPTYLINVTDLEEFIAKRNAKSQNKQSKQTVTN